MQAQRVARSPRGATERLNASATPKWSARWIAWARMERVWVLGWLAMGTVLRGWAFGWFPIREDEALYAFWARLISSGQDTMLEHVAVDKPPFFIYTLARFFDWFGPTLASGRLLNELCSLLAMILLWALARRIYGPRLARLALAFFALSPFAISFAPTLYTDPMMVTWLLLALLAASYRFGLGTGLALGMAFASKQNALLFIPLILGALVLGIGRWVVDGGRWTKDGGRRTVDDGRWTMDDGRWTTDDGQLATCHLPPATYPPPRLPLLRLPSPARLLLSLVAAVVGFLYVWHKVWQWDGWRILPAAIPSFWEQSWHSYGGLGWVPVGQWGERILAWAGVWQWLGGWLGGTLVMAVLVVMGGRWQVAGGRWQGASGRWQVAGGRWRVSSVKCQVSGVEEPSRPLSTFVRRLSSIVHRPSSIVHRPSSIALRPSSFVLRPSSIVHHPSSTHWDRLFLAFILAYLVGHVVFSFQPWDRYLLGMAPVLALLSARGAVAGWQRLRLRPRLRWLATAGLAAALLAGSGRATLARIPVGSDHGAYVGIDTVAAYLHSVVPDEGGVLYQRWLGWHWQWYLWDGPHGRVYWADPAMLVDDLRSDPFGHSRWVVFPGRHQDERPALAQALHEVGLRLAPRLIVRGADGSAQFTVYHLVPEATDAPD